ncbi:MAG: epoxyqueuosine reductase QueH [Desulfovibrio sp.]|jgi:predicted adenine nucleotide alpha hydrolase (AANH) superfamily ATPase|nr:epoxyqueuosine reductase QueH [Desulfovibrio sp.]
MRILVHVCCGPCAAAVLRGYAASGHEPHGFFYNPNIHPLAEYMRRRQGAAQVAARLDVPLLFADTRPEAGTHFSGSKAAGRDLPDNAPDASEAALWSSNDTRVAPEAGQTLPAGALLPADDPSPWLRAVLGILESKGDRCPFCLRLRIFACAEQARRRGFDAFSTSLLYSRRQRHDTIRALGEEAGTALGIAFAYRDFRPCWDEGIRLSKEWGIYRQQYCGCLFSEYERHARAFGAAAAGD